MSGPLSSAKPGPKPATRCTACGCRLGADGRYGRCPTCRRAKDAAYRREKYGQHQALPGGRRRAANVTNVGMVDRVLRCPGCREFKRFDSDEYGRALEVCRCGVRWCRAVAS